MAIATKLMASLLFIRNMIARLDCENSLLMRVAEVRWGVGDVILFDAFAFEIKRGQVSPAHGIAGLGGNHRARSPILGFVGRNNSPKLFQNAPTRETYAALALCRRRQDVRRANVGDEKP
jgi:hypothetical protein